MSKINTAINEPVADRKALVEHTSTAVKELVAGLSREQKFIDPKYFYDERGSELFDAITEQPEYYPTRTEKAILSSNAIDIAAVVGVDSVLIEPGAGTCEKVRYLLNELEPSCYVPQDISGEFLAKTAQKLREDFPDLDVREKIGDFTVDEEWSADLPEGRRVLFYPGSTIGNFEPASACSFLKRMGKLVGSDGGVLVGVDLQKDKQTLEDAYNDAAGVTADFNINVLSHINSVADADFDPEAFSHSAFYNEEKHRIEMHLVSECDQDVTVCDTVVTIAAGENIHTENSYKYTVDAFRQMAETAGLALRKTWTDSQALFALHYMEPDC